MIQGNFGKNWPCTSEEIFPKIKKNEQQMDNNGHQVIAIRAFPEKNTR